MNQVNDYLVLVGLNLVVYEDVLVMRCGVAWLG